MIQRLVRNLRPLVKRANVRGMCCSRGRSIPIISPWKHRGLWTDYFNDRIWRQRDSHFDNMFRRMERMMGPRTFDAYYVRPRDITEGAMSSEVSKVKYDNTTFEIKLNVNHYADGELNVKLTGNRLAIGGKHEQKADEHGYVAREFNREFTVPEDVDLETLTSSISDEGVLTVQGQIKGAEKPAEKIIEIQKEVHREG